VTSVLRAYAPMNICISQVHSIIIWAMLPPPPSPPPFQRHASRGRGYLTETLARLQYYCTVLHEPKRLLPSRVPDCPVNESLPLPSTKIIRMTQRSPYLVRCMTEPDPRNTYRHSSLSASSPSRSCVSVSISNASDGSSQPCHPVRNWNPRVASRVPSKNGITLKKKQPHLETLPPIKAKSDAPQAQAPEASQISLRTSLRKSVPMTARLNGLFVSAPRIK
jgi:hypothetical protein